MASACESYRVYSQYLLSFPTTFLKTHLSAFCLQNTSWGGQTQIHAKIEE